MSESHAFNQLNLKVQNWVWKQNWGALRDIQELAIEPILKADRDIIISASTASGKTEAAFLPACSNLADKLCSGVGILYISPLKALINDQYRRLEGLCEILDLPVTAWHGDVLYSKKNKLIKEPRGIILITPESFESLLLNKTAWCVSAFSDLRYIIIDEFHAFIGTERGKQLQSLLHRLEFLIQKVVPRIALSATLGEMQQVAKSLREKSTIPCEIIESKGLNTDLKIQLKGYLSLANYDDETSSAFNSITSDLYKFLRGKSHLVFANSRRRTEEIAVKLADYSELEGVPNEFFPHHGSLSKDIREALEKRLQEGKKPTTAICTMTLELGIDIGNVNSIAQVTAPHSVASLRQRLGRSGRRGEAAILRMFIEEQEITSNSHISDKLRLETFQCIAMVNLFLNKWYEPPPENQYHFSTLVQQTLSVIGQYGGVRANQLWSLLCDTGAFFEVNQTLYSKFLRVLGEQDLITQTEDGQIVLGYKGEKVIGHYTFYSAFNTPEEYRLEFEGRILGTIPIDFPLFIGQLILFAGKKWQVMSIEEEKKLIILKRAGGGRPPKFGGNGQGVHDIVRKEMFNVYLKKEPPIYLDKTAKRLFEEGVHYFYLLDLNKKSMLQMGNTIHLFPWLGDKIINTLVMLFRREGVSADCFAGIIDISNTDIESLLLNVGNILKKEKPTPAELASHIENTVVEKHDVFLSKELRELDYGLRMFDIDGAWCWLESLLSKEKTHKNE